MLELPQERRLSHEHVARRILLAAKMIMHRPPRLGIDHVDARIEVRANIHVEMHGDPESEEPRRREREASFPHRAPRDESREDDEPRDRRPDRFIQSHVPQKHGESEGVYDQLRVAEGLLLDEEKEHEDPPVHEHGPQMKPDAQSEEIDDQIHETTRMASFPALLLVESLLAPFIRRKPPRVPRGIPVPLEGEPRAQPHHEEVERVHLRFRRIEPMRVGEGEVEGSRERARVGHESAEPPLERGKHEPQGRHRDQIAHENGERAAHHGKEIDPSRRLHRQRQHREHSPHEGEERRPRRVRYSQDIRRRDEFAAVPEHERRRHRERIHDEGDEEDHEGEYSIERRIRHRCVPLAVRFHSCARSFAANRKSLRSSLP